MKDIIILGAGGSGFDVASIIHHINRITPTWNLLGFLDDNPLLKGPRFAGYEVLGSIDDCVKFPNAWFVSSIAHSNNRYIRRKIYDKVKQLGGKFATIIHPSVVIYDEAVIGEGTVINANGVIGSRVKIGDNVHLSYGCNIGHECVIHNHVAMGNGVNLSSGVDVGEDTYIGCGVSSTYDVNIANNTLVTVGSSIVRNLRETDNNTWIGNPAENSILYMKKQSILNDLVKKE